MSPKSALWLVAALLMLPGESARSQPAEGTLRLSFLLTSDYKHYGLSQTKSRPGARFSADYEHPTGFFAGGFLANVRYAFESGFHKSRDIQENYYAGYQWRGSVWASRVSISRYVYPDITVSYDYTLATVGISFKDRYFLETSRSNNYLAIYGAATQYRAGIAIPTIKKLEIGLNAGKFFSTGSFQTNYSFWDLGASRVVDRFALDLRYHDNSYHRSSILGEHGDDRWVFSVAYAITSRAPGRDRR